MENEKVLVSIGLPVYNGGKYIQEALDSVLSQTYTNFELIISDNASTDETEEICRKYERADSRIRYVRHEKNQGGYFNFHYCVRNARGPYFTWLAHDDILEKHFLEETVNYLSSHKECVLVSGDFEFINESGFHIDNFGLSRTRQDLPWKYRCRELFRYPANSKIYLLMYGLMQTEMIKKVYPQIYMIKMIKGSEMPMLCRIATAGQMVSVSRVLRKCRLHDESTSRAESLKIDKKTLLVKKFVLLANIWQIRFDLMRVLLKSNYPLSQKFYVLRWAYMKYLENFLERAARLPRKIQRYFKFSEPTRQK